MEGGEEVEAAVEVADGRVKSRG